MTTQLVKWWCKMNRITRFLTDLNQATQPFPIITEQSSFSFEGNLVWPLKGKLSVSAFAVREKFWWLLGMKKSQVFDTNFVSRFVKRNTVIVETDKGTNWYRILIFLVQHVDTTHYTLPSTRYTLHTTRYTLHATHYTLHTTHYTLHTTHYPLHATHYTLHATYYSLLAAHYTLHTTHYTLTR